LLFLVSETAVVFWDGQENFEFTHSYKYYVMTKEATNPQNKHADGIILPSKNTYKRTLE